MHSTTDNMECLEKRREELKGKKRFSSSLSSVVFGLRLLIFRVVQYFLSKYIWCNTFDSSMVPSRRSFVSYESISNFIWLEYVAIGKWRRATKDLLNTFSEWRVVTNRILNIKLFIISCLGASALVCLCLDWCLNRESERKGAFHIRDAMIAIVVAPSEAILYIPSYSIEWISGGWRSAAAII